MVASGETTLMRESARGSSSALRGDLAALPRFFGLFTAFALFALLGVLGVVAPPLPFDGVGASWLAATMVVLEARDEMIASWSEARRLVLALMTLPWLDI